MDIVFECPNCKSPFLVNEKDFNCKILRHAVFKNTLKEINPHSSKIECDKLIADDLVFGCAKPLTIVKNDKNKYIVTECDYI